MADVTDKIVEGLLKGLGGSGTDYSACYGLGKVNDPKYARKLLSWGCWGVHASPNHANPGYLTGLMQSFSACQNHAFPITDREVFLLRDRDSGDVCFSWRNE